MQYLTKYTFRNPEMGIESQVFHIKQGEYVIRLHDTDADMTLPTVRKTETYSEAVKVAKSWANLP